MEKGVGKQLVSSLFNHRRYLFGKIICIFETNIIHCENKVFNINFTLCR